MKLGLSIAYRNLWKSTLRYQDRRNDKGHVKIVLKYGLELLRLAGMINIGSIYKITIMSIILHDIGYSKMSEKERMWPYTESDNSPLKELSRYKHQVLGVELAYDILRPIFGDSRENSFINEIIMIVLDHDTNREYGSSAQNIVRDADKLWRYSQRCLEVTIKNKNYNFEQAKARVEILRKQIDEPNFFMTEEARQIARREIEKLKIPERL